MLAASKPQYWYTHSPLRLVHLESMLGLRSLPLAAKGSPPVLWTELTLLEVLCNTKFGHFHDTLHYSRC
jgi:hypothetical protein